jgi:hypothetical protein
MIKVTTGTMGADAFVVKGSGNVGIGIITPARKLDVNGGAIVRSSLTVTENMYNNGYRIYTSSVQFDDGTIMTSTSSFASSVSTINFSGFVDTFTAQNIDGIKIYASTISIKGNLTIGTTIQNSQYALSVKGGGIFTGQTYIGNNFGISGGNYLSLDFNTVGVQSRLSFSSGKLRITANADTTNPAIIISSINKNVGIDIGNNHPVEKLQVGGNIKNSGYRLYTSSIQFDDGSVFSSTAAFSSLADNLGNHIATTTLDMSNNSIVNISSITVGNTLTGSSATFSGNVGIGITNPSSQLHIAGDNDPALTISRGSGASGFRIVEHPEYGVVEMQIATNTSPSPTLWETKVRIGEGEGANTKLLLNPTGGNVGIGTVSPGARLDLGNGYGGSGEKFLIYNDNTSGPLAGTKVGFYMDRFGSNNVNFVVPTSSANPGSFMIVSKDTSDTTLVPRMTVLGQSGNVGIGTTSPTKKLDVNGDVRAYGNLSVYAEPKNFLMDAGFNDLSVYTGDPLGDKTSGKVQLGPMWNGFGAPPFWYGYKVDLLISGNVGIRTMEPQARMDIVTGSDELRVSYSTSTGGMLQLRANYDGTTEIQYNAYTNTPGLLIKNSAGNAVITATAENNIGIGTTSPEYKLEVIGNLGVSQIGYQNGGGSWGYYSDKRLKKDIQPLLGALNKISQLQPITYQWINPAEHSNSTNTYAGFVAQDVAQIFPEWVFDLMPKGKDEALVPKNEKVKSLYFPNEFFAYIVEAVKELKEKNDTLKAEIDNLKTQNSGLEDKIKTLEEKVGSAK